MATEAPTTTRWSGWVFFGVVMLMIAGGTRIIDGLWALKRDNDLSSAPVLKESAPVRLQPRGMGMDDIVLGVLLIVAGFALLNGAQWALWFGIVFVSIAIFMHFVWMYVFPVQALVGVVIDAFVLYALLAYSGPDEAY